MRYSTGRTWQPKPFEAERFDVTLDEADYGQLCLELDVDPARVPLAARYQLLRLWCFKIEAAENVSRGYEPKAEGSEVIKTTEASMAAIAAKYRGD